MNPQCEWYPMQPGSYAEPVPDEDVTQCVLPAQLKVRVTRIEDSEPVGQPEEHWICLDCFFEALAFNVSYDVDLVDENDIWAFNKMPMEERTGEMLEIIECLIPGQTQRPVCEEYPLDEPQCKATPVTRIQGHWYCQEHADRLRAMHEKS